MILHHVEGYRHSHGTTSCGWIEFNTPAERGLIRRVQIVHTPESGYVVHDIHNVRIANESLPLGILPWWLKQAPVACKFYFRRIDLTAGTTRIARSS